MMLPMQLADISKSPSYTSKKLVAARLAHSTAKLAFIKNRADAGPLAAERAASASVVAAREAHEGAQSNAPHVHACAFSHCCGLAEHARGSHYAHETNCAIHGNQTKGTCE